MDKPFYLIDGFNDMKKLSTSVDIIVYIMLSLIIETIRRSFFPLYNDAIQSYLIFSHFIEQSIIVLINCNDNNKRNFQHETIIFKVIKNH